MTSKAEHWENVFATKAETDFSWYQPVPKTSLDFLTTFNLPPSANIIDVGGGDSYFIDTLLEHGYENIYLLDISSQAINRVKKRLGPAAEKVHFIHSDILDFKPAVQFDFWHDRAAFHFLTTDEHIHQYVSTVSQAVKPNAHFVLGTFSENGPNKCSGLDIRQYNTAAMKARFNPHFDLVRCMEEGHLTPFNTMQQFLFCSFKRKCD